MIGKLLRTSWLAPLAFLAAVPAAAQQTSADTANPYAFTQDYAPDPAVWVMEDEDTTIYLLGTIHALPRGFRWRSPRINAIIEEADVLVVESSDFAQSDDPIDAEGKLAGRMANRRPTSRQLSPEGAVLWRDLVGRSVYPFEAIDSMPVMVALMSLSFTGEGRGESLSAYGVETILEREFRSRRRPIEVIEDSGAVTYSLLRLDNEAIIADLDARLIDWGGKAIGAFYDPDYVEAFGDEYWKAEHDWAQGRVSENFSVGFGPGLIGEAIDDDLLDRRNTEWAAWLEARLEQPGTTLVAVGAGHFEGENSVLVKLRERGASYRRIN